MIRRLLQCGILLSLVTAVAAPAWAGLINPPKTCRDWCYYEQGSCEGDGYHWQFDCSTYSATYNGICDLDAYCVR